MEGRDALRVAAGVAGRAAVLKAAVVGGVIFLCLLLLLGVLGGRGAGSAYADSCGDRGQPGADLPGSSTGQTPGGDFRKKQIGNAKIIDAAAQEQGLSGRATLIALMTALQESTLINLKYGHLDSIGLFQQRPSQGWGTREQIMNPTYSSRMFFYGADSGSPRGLTDIQGWETMAPGVAAQAVQASAYPTLYAGQEDAAREIAQQAQISLSRPGDGQSTDGGEQPATDDPGQESGDCYAEGTPGAPGAPGGAFHDGTAGWPQQVRNPRSTADAIAWARREADTGGKNWYRLCLAFVAKTHGWSFSGVNYAIDHYRQMPPEMRNDKDRTPPPGALMYWDTGQRAGHVAIYLGGGEIASNDILRPGYIDVVPASDIETKWGAKYLGWAPPYFPKGG